MVWHGLSVSHEHEFCKNNWTDGEVVWVADYCGPKSRVLDGDAHWRHLVNTMNRVSAEAAMLFCWRYCRQDRTYVQ